MEYSELYRRLSVETAMVAFLKKDANVRLMLCTRSIQTARLCANFDIRMFDSRDKVSSIETGNIAVFDLIIEEVRMFNNSRLLDINWLGSIGSFDQLAEAVGKFEVYKQWYENSNIMTLNFDTFEDNNTSEV